MTRDDYFTNTEHDAALYESHRAEPDDDRPTLAELTRDEAEQGWLGWDDEPPRAVEDVDVGEAL